MPDNLFIKAISTLIINDAVENLNHLAEMHNKIDERGYKDNMILLTGIGNAIRTGKDKGYLVEVFNELVKMQKEDEEDDIINQAKDLL